MVVVNEHNLTYDGWVAKGQAEVVGHNGDLPDGCIAEDQAELVDNNFHNLPG